MLRISGCKISCSFARVRNTRVVRDLGFTNDEDSPHLYRYDERFNAVITNNRNCVAVRATSPAHINDAIDFVVSLYDAVTASN